MLSEELYKLKDFFKDNPKVAICFSGGVNSTFLLYIGLRCNTEITAYFVKTQFQPQSELEKAKALAKQFHINMKTVNANILCDARIAENSRERCLLCKNKLFHIIKKAAAKDGFKTLIDGAAASGLAEGCSSTDSILPGFVRSPLREYGIAKTKVRLLSKKAGLNTWDKPHYSCMASHVPEGTEITAEILRRIERAERELLSIGFADFNIGMLGRTANLKLSVSQMESALEKREKILERLGPDFDTVLLDLAGN